MRLRFFAVVLTFVSALLCTTVASASTPQTFLTLISQPGDYVGGGTTETYTPSDGTFTVTNTTDTASIQFHTPSYSHFWILQFGSPTSQKFGRGEYEGAQRTAFRSPTKPGIDVGGDGRGCNTTTGRFLVSDFALNTDGTIARLAIDFEQHCEGAPPALYGSFRYNSAVTAVPRFGIGNTYGLKGNEGTSDATIMVSLCLPSSSVVQVRLLNRGRNCRSGDRLRFHHWNSIVRSRRHVAFDHHSCNRRSTRAWQQDLQGESQRAVRSCDRRPFRQRVDSRSECFADRPGLEQPDR